MKFIIGISATDLTTHLKNKNVVNSSEIFKFYISCQESYIELVVDIKKRFELNDCINNAQELDKEWRELALVELEPSNSIDIMEYWRKVFCLKNSLGEIYFPNIFFVMRLLLVLPFSNASVERLFSDLKNIKTMHRNKNCFII